MLKSLFKIIFIVPRWFFRNINEMVEPYKDENLTIDKYVKFILICSAVTFTLILLM